MKKQVKPGYDKAIENKGKLLAAIKKKFPIDDYGAAGVYYSTKTKTCIGMAGNYLHLDFTGELKYKPSRTETVHNKHKFLDLVIKKFGFEEEEASLKMNVENVQKPAEVTYYSKKLNAWMGVAGDEVELTFQEDGKWEGM